MGLLLNGSSWLTTTSNYVRPSTNHTVMYWLRLTSTAGGVRRPFGHTGVWEARTNGDDVLISDYLQSGTLNNITINPGTFQHIAFIQNVTGGQRLAYIDGVLVDTINTTAFAGQQTGLLNIGVSPGGAGQGWFGGIDDIRVYNRVLSQEEIQTIYACRGTDGITTDLDLWYPLNDGSEGAVATVAVEVIQGLNCTTVTGSPVYDFSAGIQTRRVA